MNIEVKYPATVVAKACLEMIYPLEITSNFYYCTQILNYIPSK